MKLSKQRRKARSLFKRRVTWVRHDDGTLNHDEPGVEVAVVRGRQWTKPQCAKQKDG